MTYIEPGIEPGAPQEIPPTAPSAPEIAPPSPPEPEIQPPSTPEPEIAPAVPTTPEIQPAETPTEAPQQTWQASLEGSGPGDSRPYQ